MVGLDERRKRRGAGRQLAAQPLLDAIEEFLLGAHAGPGTALWWPELAATHDLGADVVGEVAGEVEMPEPAISDLADAAAEFIAGMGEPVDLEEVTIPRKEFKRAKKVIAEVATLRQQLAERDETIKRIKALL